MGRKLAILEISLNTRDFSSVWLPARGVTYPQRCVGQTISLQIYTKPLHSTTSLNYYLFNMLKSFIGIVTNIYLNNSHHYLLSVMKTRGGGGSYQSKRPAKSIVSVTANTEQVCSRGDGFFTWIQDMPVPNLGGLWQVFFVVLLNPSRQILGECLKIIPLLDRHYSLSWNHSTQSV
jgi:hypothetical protein